MVAHVEFQATHQGKAREAAGKWRKRNAEQKKHDYEVSKASFARKLPEAQKARRQGKCLRAMERRLNKTNEQRKHYLQLKNIKSAKKRLCRTDEEMKEKNQKSREKWLNRTDEEKKHDSQLRHRNYVKKQLERTDKERKHDLQLKNIKSAEKRLCRTDEEREEKNRKSREKRLNRTPEKKKHDSQLVKARGPTTADGLEAQRQKKSQYDADRRRNRTADGKEHDFQVRNRHEAREASRQSLRKYNASITKEKKDGLLARRRLEYAALTWKDLMAARQKCRDYAAARSAKDKEESHQIQKDLNLTDEQLAYMRQQRPRHAMRRSFFKTGFASRVAEMKNSLDLGSLGDALQKQWPSNPLFDQVKDRLAQIASGHMQESMLVSLDIEFWSVSGKIFEIGITSLHSDQVIINSCIRHDCSDRELLTPRDGSPPHSRGLYAGYAYLQRIYDSERMDCPGTLEIHQVAAQLQAAGITPETIILTWHTSYMDITLLREFLVSGGYRNIPPPNDHCVRLIPEYRIGLPVSPTGKKFPADLEILFPLLFAGHVLVDKNHSALPDAQQLRLMTLLLLELQKPQHLRQLSQFPSSTQKFIALGQYPSTFLQHWLGSQFTVNSPSFIGDSVASTTEVAIISYTEEQDVVRGMDTVNEDDLNEAHEIDIAMEAFEDADDDIHEMETLSEAMYLIDNEHSDVEMSLFSQIDEDLEELDS